MRDEGFAIVTFDKLHSLLATRLQAQLSPGEALDDATLKTVLGFLEGPGVVQQLSYGEIVLLQPEWINAGRASRAGASGCLTHSLRVAPQGGLACRSRTGKAVKYSHTSMSLCALFQHNPDTHL